jgi:coenzyme F420-reducing hydrogenase alpha subunit
MKKIGNEIVRVVGGREIHPINVKVGGFHRLPRKKDLQALVDDLRWGRDRAVETAQVTATFEFPDLEQDYDFVALHHPDEYPFNGGRFVSSRGLDIAIREYEFHFEERHIPHSNALHSIQKGVGAYHVGPLARYNLNFEQLSPMAKQVALDLGFAPPVRNPFKSIVVRSIETVYAFEEALRIIDQYDEPDAPAVNVQPQAGIGFGASEAPRGTLYHRYRLDDEGVVLDAKIVPPTAQNQPSIEADIRKFVAGHIDMDRERLTWGVEQTVRNYDPCISCATHFVRISWE